jgi:polyisoprenoid-binding protein YceI
MRTTTRTALIAVLALAPASIAWTSVNDSVLTLAPQSRLWFDGTSTVRAFTCKAGLLEADVTATTPAAVSAVAGGQKAISAVVVRVPAARLDCDNGKMNDHMMKALKATEHPMITYKVASYELATVEGALQATLTGTLTLGGVEKPLVVVTKAKEEGGMLRVTGTQKLTMTEFGIKPPTLMMNTLKVGNDVTVGFDLLLKN